MVKGLKYAKNWGYPTNTLVTNNQASWSGRSWRTYMDSIAHGFRSQMVTMTDKLKLQSPDSFIPVGTGEITGEQASALRIYYMSCETKVVFTNWANVGCTVQLYEVHPKKLTNQAPWEPIARGLEEGQGHPWVEDNLASDGKNLPVGTRPNESQMFKDVWHVDRSWEFHMAPGATHEHRSLYALNKMKSAAEFVQDTATGIIAGDNTGKDFIPGVTRMLMIALTGDPVKVTTGSAVTTGVTQVGIIYTQKFKFSMHEPNAGDYEVTGTQFQDTAPGALTTRQEDGDEVAVDLL